MNSNTEGNSPIIAFRTSHKTREWIEYHARRKGVNMSDVIRNAVETMLYDTPQGMCCGSGPVECDHVW